MLGGGEEGQEEEKAEITGTEDIEIVQAFFRKISREVKAHKTYRGK